MRLLLTLLLALITAPAWAQTVVPGQRTSQTAMAIVCSDPANNLSLAACGSEAQGPVLNNAQTTSATNTAQTITLTGTANRRWTIRQAYGSCSAGTSAAITLQDGATTILTVPGLSTTISALIPYPPATGITITAGNNLVLNIPTCGVGNTSTVTILADRQ